MSLDQRKQRRFQFSLRAIMLLMLLVCMFFAGRWSRQREMERMLQEAEELRQLVKVAQEESERAQGHAKRARAEAVMARHELAEARDAERKAREEAARAADAIRNTQRQRYSEPGRIGLGMKADELELHDRLWRGEGYGRPVSP